MTTTANRRATAPLRLPTAVAVVVVAGFYGLFFALPLGSMLVRGLSESNVADTLGSARTWRVMWFTTWQALVSTAATFVVGLPIAGVVARYEFRGRSLLRALATVPFVLPTVVVASAFLSLERAFALEDTRLAVRGTVWGIIAAHVFFNVAVVVRSVGGWWSQLDDRPETAARTLGASPLRAFLTVTLPRLRPALLSASAIVFLFTFSSFGVVLVLGNLRRATIETEIWRFAVARTDFGTAATLGVLQLVAVVAMLVVNNRLQLRLTVTEQTRVRDVSPTGLRQRTLVASVGALSLFVFGLPIGVLVERSLATETGYGFTFYEALGNQDQRVPLLPVSAWTALANSLTWALLATVIATVVGTLAAILATDRRRPRLAQATDVGLLLPLGTSAVLVGFGMMIALDTPPLDWRGRWWIVPVAQAVVGVPFVLRSVATALRSIDPALREVAATLGASPRHVVREIDLPIASRGVVVGSAFAFAVAVGEFGATSFLARPQRPTVPTAIYRLLGRPGTLAFGQAMALSVILVLVTAAAVLVIERLRTAVSGEL